MAVNPLKVAINAQLNPGGDAGGVEQFLASLIYSLGRLTDGPEQYSVIGPWGNTGWLSQLIGPNQVVVAGPPPEEFSAQQRNLAALKRRLGPLRGPLGSFRNRIAGVLRPPQNRPRSAINASGAFYASLRVDAIHFPYQSAIANSVLPTIYNPHDLQHLHYPEFFTAEQRRRREEVYRTGCDQARMVAVLSEWARQDIIRQYACDPAKVVAIWQGPPTEIYGPVSAKTVENVRGKFGLWSEFALYPAQTWPHKNHVRLLEALHVLRRKHGMKVNLVCTGKKNAYWPTIETTLQKLGLENQVRFLGYLPTDDLRALYRLAKFVVFPSLFEGGGLPAIEAMSEGVPLACSRVTSLPEYAGDAALYFDPTSVKGIAEALERMATDDQLRASLRTAGAARARLFTGERSAKSYRALYRKVAGHELSEEDQGLLSNGQPAERWASEGQESGIQRSYLRRG